MCVGEGEGSRPVQRVKSRETIDGWPMLTVETELNGDSKCTNERRPPLVGCRAGTRDFCSALAALICPVQNICFLTAHFFNSFVPIAPASWAGSRAGPPVS